MDIFQSIGHLFVGAGLLLSSFLGHTSESPAAKSVEPTLTVHKETSASFYKASGSINYQDYNITMDISIPKAGGAVTGKISGDCTGDITGQYDGKDNGVINGQANGSCRLLFVQIPGKITFDGTVNKTEETAHLFVTAKVDSFEKSRNINLSFH